MDHEIWILDTETTGLNGKPVEVAGIKIDADLNVLEEFEQRFNPGIPIEEGATAVHGITDADVADKPTMESFFGPQTTTIDWIGHNAHFDVRVSKPIIVPTRTLCTLRLARQFIKGVTNYKLETLQKELALSEQRSHSALGDCRTTLELLVKIVDLAGVPLETLFERQAAPKVIARMPFGRHKGLLLIQMPPKDRAYMLANFDLDKDLRYSLEQIKDI